MAKCFCDDTKVFMFHSRVHHDKLMVYGSIRIMDLVKAFLQTDTASVYMKLLEPHASHTRSSLGHTQNTLDLDWPTTWELVLASWRRGHYRGGHAPVSSLYHITLHHKHGPLTTPGHPGPD